MASTSSIAFAQDIMLCELCDKVPLQMYCNKCAVSLCKGCVADHIISDTTKAHEVVVYKMRNVDPVFPDCETHSHQKCEMYCQECDIPMCVKCVTSGAHIKRQSKVIEFTKIFKSKKEKLRQKSNELENSIYPKYEDGISELENLISRLPESYEKLMSALSKHGDVWHREIDIIINNTKQEVEKMKNKDLTCLKKSLTEMKNLLSTIYQAIMDLRKILKTNNVTEIMNTTSDIQEFINLPKRFDVNPPTFVPSPIQGEQLRKMFGTLKASSISETRISPTDDTTMQPEKQILDSPKEASSLDTETNYLKGVACLSPNEFWVCSNYDKTIKRFHMDGSLQQTVTTTTGAAPDGITVTQQGELIFTDWKDRSIYIVRNEKPEKMITPKDWIPKQVCSTASGDLLVSMEKDNKTHQKVVRYRGTTEKQSIQFDQDGNPWFSTGDKTLFIAENRNGDLCASDFKAKQVVVINQAGKLRFRYTGNLSSKKYTSFKPWGIATDVLNQILVADDDNNCIHIIHQDGHFIRYIDNCHLSDLFALSIKDNFLFVAEYKAGKVKKIQYLTGI